MFVDFSSLKLGWKPNQYLVAPADLCSQAKPNSISPEYEIPVQALRDAFLAMAGRQPRTLLAEEGPQAVRLVQRSPFFRFPDDIDVAFLERGENRSSLAIYSRARIGIRDFGVNAARVKSWMVQLEADLNGPD